MPKDYKGGARSGMYGLGASNRSKRDRDELDFYATPPKAVERLLEMCKKHNINLPTDIWEPAVGMGHIAATLKKHGYRVEASDVLDRNYPGTRVENFFDATECRGDAIITNPPYKYGAQFVIQAMNLLKDGQYCCMLLKIQFQEGNERAKLLFKSGLNPEWIFDFPDRINCAKQGNFKKDNEIFEEATRDWTQEELDELDEPESDSGGQIAYAWYIWRKGFNDYTKMDWL